MSKKITTVLITPTHLNHVMALGGLVDNLYGKGTAINVRGINEAVCALKDLFLTTAFGRTLPGSRVKD